MDRLLEILQELIQSYSELQKEVKIVEESTLTMADELETKTKVLQELYTYLQEQHDKK